MMKHYLSLVILTFFIFSCATKKNHPTKLDKAWLDTITKNSDTSYTKPYFRTDFVTATYYINNKDSSTCQLMKDSAGLIRQVIIVTKNVRTFFGQYYANGQLTAWLPLDEFGQYHGDATYYYQSGAIESNGFYNHGFKKGAWENYDDKGKLVSVEDYGQNGQLIKTTKTNN
ncbi:toxin-antitoxin system YwqK family antitoxin [Ferruginibacter sp. SUN106]|uniref:toxin-antitoxin system YwqK family antitoxin n=1 Tax=Ferruginibacter sp. SUN106 TaxID=2978348 RepID=UPI003D3678C8